MDILPALLAAEKVARPAAGAHPRQGLGLRVLDTNMEDCELMDVLSVCWWWPEGGSRAAGARQACRVQKHCVFDLGSFDVQ